MKQTDWETMDEVPAAVFKAFAASQFSGGMVQNVICVQYTWGKYFLIERGWKPTE